MPSSPSSQSPDPRTEEVDSPSAAEAPDSPILEELLVEEISIDGMCGVY